MTGHDPTRRDVMSWGSMVLAVEFVELWVHLHPTRWASSSHCFAELCSNPGIVGSSWKHCLRVPMEGGSADE